MDKFFIQTQHKGILMITNNMILQANGFYVFKHDSTTHHCHQDWDFTSSNANIENCIKVKDHKILWKVIGSRMPKLKLNKTLKAMTNLEDFKQEKYMKSCMCRVLVSWNE